jgi:hypothetical protein
MDVQTARRVCLRSPAEPRPHHDCDKRDKRCRRHRRETPVYRIKLKRISAESSGAAISMDQHLSSPKNTALPHADHGENDSDAPALMLSQMGQDILLFGTGCKILLCPDM